MRNPHRPGTAWTTAVTNIGSTLVFPRAAAAVTDVGVPLSHAAIVARELGHRVRVDGGRGIVEVVG